MFSKNLKYYRLKNNFTKKELASKVNVTPMAISHYENGDRRPNMDVIKELADVLNIKVSDFLHSRSENLSFVHGEFRKNSSLSVKQQEYVREAVEEYFGRFYSVVEILGGDVLPKAPECHSIKLSDDIEENAKAMRLHLRIAEEGPIGNLIELLENKGILIYVCDIDNDKFSGMNGMVSSRPYIIINGMMTPERIRSTIAHEMAHFIFSWPKDMEDKEVESMAMAISGAFLFSKEDALRELGVHRSSISQDMYLVCKEYGISMFLLVKRAQICGIINDSTAKGFYIQASKKGWRTNEPTRIEPEESLLFAQLIYRAVGEQEISVQKGAELLQIPYAEVAKQCSAAEV